MEGEVDKILIKRSKCLEKITELFDNNINNPFIIDKIHEKIMNLDLFVVNIKKEVEKENNNICDISNNKAMFKENFLNHNQFYYNATNNKYFYYDGVNYFNESEDDIHFKCVTGISNNPMLNNVKNSTKNTILKEIKSKSIFKSIPETITIQNVINNMLLFFKNKNEIKYFLTLIGDNILKKGGQEIFFVNPSSKPFLKKIQERLNICFGNYNVIDSFKTQYREQSFYNIRLININNNIENSNLWINFIENNILDIVCVALHYSNRYSTCENFIYKYLNEDERKDILFLKTRSNDDVIEQFINNCLIIDKTIKTEITWKWLHFLWKKFLDHKNMPNIIYTNTLKIKIQEYYKSMNIYNCELEAFQFTTSKYLPNVENFLNFWNENMIYEEKESFIGEFEISEIVLLYNDYKIGKGEKVSNINEDFVIEILHHFMDDIEVENNKYILNIYCKLWDKENDVKLLLSDYFSTDENPTVYGAYEYYTEKFQGKKFIVSKRFFSKCFSNYFSL